MPSRVESRVSDRVVLYRCDKTAVWLARAVELAIASVLQDASPQSLRSCRPGSSATRASLRLDVIFLFTVLPISRARTQFQRAYVSRSN